MSALCPYENPSAAGNYTPPSLRHQRKCTSVAPLAKSKRYEYVSRSKRGYATLALIVTYPETAKEGKL